MIRAVIDANVFVSAALKKRGPPYAVLKAAGIDYTLVWSVPVVAECARVVRYPKLRDRFETDPLAWLRNLTEIATLLDGDLPRIHAVAADPSDDVYLATALAGAAPYLVSGDRKHLLALREFAGVRILTPAAFLEVLGKP